MTPRTWPSDLSFPKADAFIVLTKLGLVMKSIWMLEVSEEQRTIRGLVTVPWVNLPVRAPTKTGAASTVRHHHPFRRPR